MNAEKLIPEIWPEWKVAEKIGQGTYGSVYLIRRVEKPSIEAAVKVISIPSNDEEIAELKRQGFDDNAISDYLEKVADDWSSEIQFMRRYQGMPHFVSIEDAKVVGRDNGAAGRVLLIRMEYLKSLQTYLSDKTLREDEVIDLGIQICDALDICHSDGVIHRDVKPENIFVCERSSSGVLYKLGDFGISRKMENEAASLSMKGAPAYMAPEVIHGCTYDSRADLYALGLTLYRLMNNNRLPFLPAHQLFTHDDYEYALRMRLSGMPLPPASDASPAFNRVIQKACSTDPERRYSTAAAFSKALYELNSGITVENRTKQYPWMILVALVTILVTCGAGMLIKNGKNVFETEHVLLSEKQPEWTSAPLLAAEAQSSPLRELLNDISEKLLFTASGRSDSAILVSEFPLEKCISLAPDLQWEQKPERLNYAGDEIPWRILGWDEVSRGFIFTYSAESGCWVAQNNIKVHDLSDMTYLSVDYRYPVDDQYLVLRYHYQSENQPELTEVNISVPGFELYACSAGGEWKYVISASFSNMPLQKHTGSIQINHDRRHDKKE